MFSPFNFFCNLFSLCKDSLLKVLRCHWWHFSHLPLQIVAVPVTLVMCSLVVRIMECHSTGDAGEKGVCHLDDL